MPWVGVPPVLRGEVAVREAASASAEVSTRMEEKAPAVVRETCADDQHEQQQERSPRPSTHEAGLVRGGCSPTDGPAAKGNSSLTSGADAIRLGRGWSTGPLWRKRPQPSAPPIPGTAEPDEIWHPIGI